MATENKGVGRPSEHRLACGRGAGREGPWPALQSLVWQKWSCSQACCPLWTSTASARARLDERCCWMRLTSLKSPRQGSLNRSTLTSSHPLPLMHKPHFKDQEKPRKPAKVTKETPSSKYSERSLPGSEKPWSQKTSLGLPL